MKKVSINVGGRRMVWNRKRFLINLVTALILMSGITAWILGSAWAIEKEQDINTAQTHAWLQSVNNSK